MSRKILTVAALAAVMLLLAACAGADINVGLGQKFSLAVKQTASISSEGFRIKFEEITEDSRCPRGVVCVWAGRVSAVVQIESEGQKQRITLSQPGLSGEASQAFGNYRIAYAIEPYPVAGKKIESEEYRLTLIITR